jgi:hypothetical protein
MKLNRFYILALNFLAIPCCALYIHKDEAKTGLKRNHSDEETTQNSFQCQLEILSSLNIEFFHLTGLNHKISAFTSKFVYFKLIFFIFHSI